MKTRMHESGQATIMVLLSMLGLLGFVGLGTDVGLLFHAKRNLQIVADAAAIAGASEYPYTGSSGANTAGQAAATANGVTNGTGGASVVVNSPPLSGAHTSTTGPNGYVEAVVSQPQSTVFMGLFGWNSVPVSARAVAYKGAKSTDCVYVMSQNASPAMALTGRFDVSVPGCGIVVDSNASNALNFTGASGTLSAGSVGVVGGATGHTSDSTPTPISGTAPVSDPLIGIATPPPYSGCTAAPGGTLTGPVNNAGTVCYSGSVNINNANLAAGTYVFTGDVTLSGTVTGTGVTFYLLGNLSALTNSRLNLTAPSSATNYPATSSNYGILFYGASTDTGTLAFNVGNASGTLQGIIYAPTMNFTLQDNGGHTTGGLQLVTDLIVNTLSDTASMLSLTSYTQSCGCNSPLTKVALVE
ncbi:pilus assembly protein TadG-related protein [Edaphobacter bradus]|uniref:pilus assembly protein TadG-related protein n=1 Tax=Edaphobacter bradus TaxID=2259016 RepID=UPI0021DF9CA9|nr:pilus assembly protein TadG-related protein [Edaphobacter bradus]